MTKSVINSFKKIEVLCAAGLIAFFFLPWLSINGIINISGYQIAELASGQIQMGSSLDEMGLSSSGGSIYQLLYLLYLIPIFSLLTIILDLMGKNTRSTSIIAGLIPVIEFLYAWIDGGNFVIDALAIGAYLTLFTAMVLLLTIWRSKSE